MTDQLDLFAEPHRELPKRLGHAVISGVVAKSILTRASGFMASYDYTLNPYSGCHFGCTYCYAAFFARSEEKRNTWGEWVEVKVNALQLLERMRTDLNGKTVYMSSVTDPYQLIERKLKLVRSLLELMAPKGVRLVVQTRSPLVARDVDVLGQFDAVKVNMTVTTDSEEVRRAFEPHCAPNNRRLAAITEVAAAGIPAVITMTPLLPVKDPSAFAERLLATGVQEFVVQAFHPEKGRFVRGTRDEALRVTRQLGWTEQRYQETVIALRECLPNIIEGQQGFAPA